MTLPGSTAEMIAALASRTPVPGGGAAAAIAAALGCASGAMAARYTTGPRWGALSAQAEALADTLSAAARACLDLADADAEAYGAVRTATKGGDPKAKREAEIRSAAIPADLLATCALHAAGLAAFIPACNPQLLSDVAVGIHLLAGAGRAAWRTLAVNQPDDQARTIAQTHLEALGRSEACLPKA